jgi:inorganic pyrophosphatase
MAESMIPLNDVRSMKRVNSIGTNSDIDFQSDGEEDTLEYRLQAMDPSGKKKVSLWHDISLVHIDVETKHETSYLNFVCEIPKFTR